MRSFTREHSQEKITQGRTVVARPFEKLSPSSSICSFFEACGSVTELQRVRKMAFVTYHNKEQAQLALERLHNTELQGVRIQIHLLGGHVGMDEKESKTAISNSSSSLNNPSSNVSSTPETKHLAPTSSTTALTSEKARNQNKRKKPDQEEKMSSEEVFSGRYLVQLIRLLHNSSPRTANLLKVVALKRNNQAKEISESFGIVSTLLKYAKQMSLNIQRKRVLAFVCILDPSFTHTRPSI